MKINHFLNILLIGSLASLASCARQISSDVYASSAVGEVSTTYAGVIRSVRSVTVDDSESLGSNQAGLLGGGGAGALIGNAFGKGIAPMAVGAIVGAVGGSLIEKKIKRQLGLEYVVQLETGGLMTVVQGVDDTFAIGQAVYVIVSQFGRSRIIAQ